MLDRGVDLKAKISNLNKEALGRYDVEFISVAISTQLLVPHHSTLDKDLTKNRADDAVDVYRKGDKFNAF